MCNFVANVNENKFQFSTCQPTHCTLFDCDHKLHNTNNYFKLSFNCILSIIILRALRKCSVLIFYLLPFNCVYGIQWSFIVAEVFRFHVSSLLLSIAFHRSQICSLNIHLFILAFYHEEQQESAGYRKLLSDSINY